MSITDELRKWAGGSTISSWTAEHLTAIADRIDAEHRKVEDEWRAKNGDMWLKGYNVCHKELMEGHPVIAADLKKAGWARLPVDADGVPWYRGSQVIDPKDPDGNVKTVWIAGDNTLITDDHLFIFSANKLRHYHRPTVEDVLRGFTDAVLEWAGKSGTVAEVGTWSDVAAEYAAKLQLKEGA